VPRVMRISVGKSVYILSVAAVMVICSCEKHPLPDERHLQVEQLAPEKASHEPIKMESEKPSPSPTPAESVPANPHP
jgi:hypothetical protein